MSQIINKPVKLNPSIIIAQLSNPSEPNPPFIFENNGILVDIPLLDKSKSLTSDNINWRLISSRVGGLPYPVEKVFKEILAVSKYADITNSDVRESFLRRIFKNNGKIKIDGGLVDSYTSFKTRDNTKKFLSMTMIGITLTKDDYILMGIRGGNLKAGQFALVPGGAISYHNKIENLLETTVDKEFKEELGPFEHKKKYIGSFVLLSGRLKGIKFVYTIRTKTTAGEICALHKRAIDHYSRYKEKHNIEFNNKDKLEVEARRSLGIKGFPLDSWEHTALIKIPFSVEHIENFLTGNRDKIHGFEKQHQSIPLADVGIGTLETLLEHLSL